MTERNHEMSGERAGAQEPWSAVEGARAATRSATHKGAVSFDASPDAQREQITAEARNAIFWDLAVPRNRVSVHCDHGWVTLTGAVERAYQRSAAEADVLRVAGVRGVTNAIIVAAQPADSTPAIDAA